MHRILLGAAVGGGIAAACTMRSAHFTGTGHSDEDGTQYLLVQPELDILFVIDDSASTVDKQAVFTANFPRFVQALDAFPTGRPSLHLGVVSTTVSIGLSVAGAASCTRAPNDDGRLHNQAHVAGCVPPSDRYIADVQATDGSRLTNYTGSLEQAFSCIAQLGANGCGFEAPLEAMRRALDGSLAENAGFLRPEATLAVIVLTDEDDCSVRDPALWSLPASAVGSGAFRCQPLYAEQCDTPIAIDHPDTYSNCHVLTGSYLEDPATYHDFLTALRPHGRSVVAVIGGDPADHIATGTIPPSTQLDLLPSCTATINGNPSIGRPAIRIADFASRFTGRSLFRSVCQSDYSQVFTDIAALLFRSAGACLDGTLDVADSDRANPGLQLDCEVAEVVQLDTPDQAETPVAACAMADAETPSEGGERPCWWLRQAPETCATPSGLELHVERAAPPAAGAIVRVRCARST